MERKENDCKTFYGVHYSAFSDFFFFKGKRKKPLIDNEKQKKSILDKNK